MTDLRRHITQRAILAPGNCYVMQASADGPFVDEVRAVWAYICHAVEAPISLEICPPGRAEYALLANLLSGAVQPVSGNCLRSKLIIQTSGTTGTPKRCEHDLLHVLARKRAGLRKEKWLLTFAPYRWAGLSVILHVFKSNSTLVVPESLEPTNIVRAGLRDQATHIAITPSMLKRWRLTCDESDLRRLPLLQVTFGGEAASQPVLDAARRLWPKARITHIYAASEFGDVCSVSDGFEGVPRYKFDREGFRLSEDGELFIDGRSTGDLWQVRDNRFIFLGRTEEVINVGGAKVSPFDVERVATAIEGVIDARAFAIPSPLLGQLVGLEYCGTVNEALLKRAMRRALPKVACPVEVRCVQSIEMTEAGKTSRLMARSASCR